MTMNAMPKAKTERLIVREIDSETLVYDRGRDAASCLAANGDVYVWLDHETHANLDAYADPARATATPFSD